MRVFYLMTLTFLCLIIAGVMRQYDLCWIAAGFAAGALLTFACGLQIYLMSGTGEQQ